MKLKKAVSYILLYAVVAVFSLTTEGRTIQDPELARANEVFDAIGIKKGHKVADIGCGNGWVSEHLARRVGSKGKVFAVDIDPLAITETQARAQKADLPQIQLVLSKPDNPMLPTRTLNDAVMFISYHEMTEYKKMLTGIKAALKPGGKLGIVEIQISDGYKRNFYELAHRIPSRQVIAEATAAGFKFEKQVNNILQGVYEDSEKDVFYLLVFVKPR